MAFWSEMGRLVRTTTWYLSNWERLSTSLHVSQPNMFYPTSGAKREIVPRRLMDLDWRVGVEFGNPGRRHFVSRLPHIIWREKELGREVCELNRRGIVERQALDAS